MQIFLRIMACNMHNLIKPYGFKLKKSYTALIPGAGFECKVLYQIASLYLFIKVAVYAHNKISFFSKKSALQNAGDPGMELSMAFELL